jgi:hypothetical protein
MSELFPGNREPLKDLWIGKSDYDYTPYTEIYIAMTGARDAMGKLENSISSELERAALLNGLNPA